MELAAIIIVAITGFAMGLYLSTQISDWIDKNRKRQYMKQINIYGSMITILALGFVVYANYASGNMHKKKVECTEKPISQPVDTIRIESEHMIYHEWDSYMDSIDMDCGEQNGRHLYNNINVCVRNHICSLELYKRVVWNGIIYQLWQHS